MSETRSGDIALNDGEPIRHISIDRRLEAYESFFDHAWGKAVTKIAGSAPRLDAILFDLCLYWKSISRARALPHMAMQMAESIAHGTGTAELTNSQQLHWVLYLSQHLADKLGLTVQQRDEARKLMLDLYEEMFSRFKGRFIEFPREELWTELLDDSVRGTHEFQIGLWASQWICFSAIYGTYEDFLVRCTRVQLNDPGLQLQNYERFKVPFTDAFGENLKEHCWTDQEVGHAREIRNALAHNGGRETARLAARDHRIPVQDGQLLIEAPHVQELFALLKVRVQALVEYAVTLPAFQAIN